jgi:hypothetical protein
MYGRDQFKNHYTLFQIFVEHAMEHSVQELYSTYVVLDYTNFHSAYLLGALRSISTRSVSMQSFILHTLRVCIRGPGRICMLSSISRTWRVLSEYACTSINLINKITKISKLPVFLKGTLLRKWYAGEQSDPKPARKKTYFVPV